MILILSNIGDKTTCHVLEWLIHAGATYQVLNETNPIKSVHFKCPSGRFTFLTVNNELIDSENITAYWYRRGEFHLDSEMRNNADWTEAEKIFKETLDKEWRTVRQMLHQSANEKNSIGNRLKSVVNKLEVLSQAYDVGWDVPKTLIATDRQSVIEFAGGEKIINKSIDNVINEQIGNECYINRTVVIDHLDLPERFYPSLFQQLIPKAYELRVFYLHGAMYTAALFSQADQKTEVDFRNYNYKKPNRTVPFNLPEKVAEKVRALMRQLGLDTGSLDILVTPGKKYIFLEVNPDGQFGMISQACNYYLEKKVAETLMRPV